MTDKAQLLYRAAIDGASTGNPGPSGVGVVIMDADGKILKEIAEPIGQTTNNVAEYKALLRALEAVIDLGGTRLIVQTDSELLARQISGRYRVAASHLKGLFEQAREMIALLDSFEISHTLREGNRRADQLAKQGARLNSQLNRASSNSSPE